MHHTLWVEGRPEGTSGIGPCNWKGHESQLMRRVSPSKELHKVVGAPACIRPCKIVSGTKSGEVHRCDANLHPESKFSNKRNLKEMGEWATSTFPTWFSSNHFSKGKDKEIGSSSYARRYQKAVCGFLWLLLSVTNTKPTVKQNQLLSSILLES